MPMESSTHISHHGGDSRPSLDFPLGTALLLVVIFSLSGIFSCCYHWEKLRRTFSIDAADGHFGSPSYKHHASHTDMKQQKNESFTVIMPGDNFPKFVALPCPCEPPREARIIVEVQKPPPKPPRIAVPLY